MPTPSDFSSVRLQCLVIFGVLERQSKKLDPLINNTILEYHDNTINTPKSPMIHISREA